MKNGVIAFLVMSLFIAVPLVNADNFLSGYSILDTANNFFSNTINFFKDIFANTFNKEKVGLPNVGGCNFNQRRCIDESNYEICNERLPTGGYEWSAYSCENNQKCENGDCINIPNPQGPICGNSILERPEECDGANRGGATCQSLGYDEGRLSCGEPDGPLLQKCKILTNFCYYEHTECSENSCITVRGQGQDECSTNSDCRDPDNLTPYVTLTAEGNTAILTWPDILVRNFENNEVKYYEIYEYANGRINEGNYQDIVFPDDCDETCEYREDYARTGKWYAVVSTIEYDNRGNLIENENVVGPFEPEETQCSRVDGTCKQSCSRGEYSSWQSCTPGINNEGPDEGLYAEGNICC